MLAEVRIPNPERVIKQYPHQLSGGMRQRVMIAMALACKPDILIADEPTTALDVTIQAQILRLMKILQKEKGTAVVFITHDLGVVAQLCDEVIVMYAGSICEQGTADEIFYNPKHEYTKGLMRSIPTENTAGTKLQPITGTPIDLLNMPEGCPFAPRCENAMKVCLCHKAREILINEDHASTCWHNIKDAIAEGKMTKEQMANAALAEDMLAAMEAGMKYTATEAGKLVGLETSQKATAILRMLVAAGTVAKEEGRKTLYFVA